MTFSTLPILATTAMAAACAVLSVFVVARRWAFIGEGISHSGFGGAGLAWMLMLLVPSLAGKVWVTYVAVVIFCLATAVAIGYLSHGSRVTGDAAIGIFLVASLAFGFLAQQVYLHVRGVQPQGFEALLFGQLAVIEPRAAIGAVLVSVAVLLTVAALGKEILAYCFDPLMAQASGVPTASIHYLLMVLIALTIIVGMPITGSVLVTALLVLPGVTANLLTRRFNAVIGIAVTAGLIGAIAGVALNGTWRFIPTGPAIVLVLFLEFVIAAAVARFRPRAS